MREDQGRALNASQTAQWVGKRVGAALISAAPIRTKRARGTLLVALLALACAVCAPVALADFPYVGTGTLGEPSSWKLAPGETPSNVGGLAWKFAATPATPPSNPTEKTSVE